MIVRRHRTNGHRGSRKNVPGFAPEALTIGARHLEVGREHVASFAITGYPREVHYGWLQPLLTYPGRLDVSLHVEPIDPVTAATRLKRPLAKLESGRRHSAEHGRLVDPHVEAATEDAYELSARIARGEGKLFRLGLYLTVHGHDAQHLASEVEAVRALCASLLLDAKPTTYRAVQGWVSTLPLGLDQIRHRRTFDTQALSAAFPFTSPDLPPLDPASASGPSGVLYGFNLGSQGLVCHDRFTCDNHNAVILGRSGAGKSYLVKLELLRSLYRGVEVAVIDPEDEYSRLADAVGGTRINLGADGVKLNPFDLPITTTPDGRRHAPPDTLTRHSLTLHTMLDTLLGTELSADERAAADTAIATAYQRAGITSDPRSWTRRAPLLKDLAAALAEHDGTGADLAARLRPFTHGAFSGLFDAPTSTRPEGHLVVFNLRDLPDELKPIGTLLTLDALWRRITNPGIRKPRLVVVDEAWLLMAQPAGARFLFRLAKAARKHWAGLTVATQDVGDVLGSDLGKAVINNSATQILLRQAPQAIGEVAAAFHLSDGERQFLLAAEQGQGLLAVSATQRVAFQTVASPTEDALCQTSPALLVDPAEPGASAGLIDLDNPSDDLTTGNGGTRDQRSQGG